MPKKPNEKEVQALELYRKGKPLVEIAKILELPDSTVRRWKRERKWDDNTERFVQRSEKITNARNKQKRRKKLTESVTENMELTDREKDFALYFVQTYNATKAYQKAFGCNYRTANVKGPALVNKPAVLAEIKKLKEIKRQGILVETSDIVEKQMKIAFADITDYLEWGQEEVPIMAEYGPAMEIDEETGEKKPLTKMVNVVKFIDSTEIDGTMVNEVKLGKDGASIKLASREKAFDWLSKYFEVFPADQHKREFDKRKLELELMRIEAANKETNKEDTQNNLFDAINNKVKDDSFDLQELQRETETDSDVVEK